MTILHREVPPEKPVRVFWRCQQAYDDMPDKCVWISKRFLAKSLTGDFKGNAVLWHKRKAV